MSTPTSHAATPRNHPPVAGSESPLPRSASASAQRGDNGLAPNGAAPSTSSAVLRQSIEADRDARRERRARIERQVQAALYEQRTQHSNAVSGLKAQLLELKHQDELAALRHQAKQRESTLEQELANLHRSLEEERNRRALLEGSLRKASDAQRMEAERRDSAEAALSAELQKRGGSDGEAAELQRRVEGLQRQLQTAKAANDQLLKENRERSVADIDMRSAEEAAAAAELERLRAQVSTVTEQKAKELSAANSRMEAERARHNEQVDQLQKDAEAQRELLEEERRQRRDEKLSAAQRERGLQDAKEREVRTVEAQIAAAVAEQQAEVSRLSGLLEDERRERAHEKTAQSKKEAAEADRKAKAAKECEDREKDLRRALEEAQSALAESEAERDALKADGGARKERAATAEAKLATMRAANEALEKDKQALEEQFQTAEKEAEEAQRRHASKLAELEAKHKEGTAALNKKLREAWASAQEAEDRAREWDRALREANDRVEADTKALDAKYQSLVATHERDREHATELRTAQEAAHSAAKTALEEALAAEKSAHAATRGQLAKAESDADSKCAAMIRDHSDEMQRAAAHHEAVQRKLEEHADEERRRRNDLTLQKEALQEGFDELSKEYDAAVSSMELLEAQLQENRMAHEHAIAALTRELERNRATRSHSVAAADAAEAEAQAAKAEVHILMRQLKRNVCARCGGSSQGPQHSVGSVDYVRAAGSGPLARLSVDVTPTPDRTDLFQQSGEEDFLDGKRYGASADF